MGKAKGLPQQLPSEYSSHFTNLGFHKVTSDDVATYNCIAYAANDTTQWWEDLLFPEPGYYWPPGTHQDDDVGSVEALKRCYAAIGYEECANGSFEDGYTKVALYAKNPDDYSHAAILDEAGIWRSKLGNGYDIEHETADSVTGPKYGKVMCYMRRKIAVAADKKVEPEKSPEKVVGAQDGKETLAAPSEKPSVTN